MILAKAKSPTHPVDDCVIGGDCAAVVTGHESSINVFSHPVENIVSHKEGIRKRRPIRGEVSFIDPDRPACGCIERWVRAHSVEGVIYKNTFGLKSVPASSV